MELQTLLEGLKQASTSIFGFTAYCILIVGWLIILWKEARFKKISKVLALLPKNKRLEALELEYRLIPKNGLGASAYLKHKKQQYFYIAIYSSYIGFWGGLRYPAIELDINKF